MVKKQIITIPCLSGDEKRRVYIYTPASYKTDTEKRYPVLYMFDGHNVFFDKDATYGKSWGMKRFIDGARKDLIIVAVECSHIGNQRIVEYSPFHYENEALGRIRGKGNVYMRWLTETLKPQIDSQYRTYPDREHTFIAGSSMGGLMALFAVCRYNQVFQRAACLSPSLWVDTSKVLEMTARAQMQPDTVIYLDYGAREMSNHAANMHAIMSTVQLLMAKKINVTMRIVPDGTHSEASWEKQIPIFMDCLDI